MLVKDPVEDNATPGARRQVLTTLASAAGLFLLRCSPAPAQPRVASGVTRGDKAELESNGTPKQDAAGTPGEDLMQDHGVIERVLLIYDEVAGRLERGESADLGRVGATAGLVKRFVEEHHEQLEEAFVFPRLESQHGPLVSTLLEQHAKGHGMTQEILRASQSSDRGALARALRSFSRMYRPHAAWEDSVLFPAFRRVLGRDAYEELGEKFAEEEHQRFGASGLDEIVAQVSQIEQGLGIGDLAHFTPT
jgi:hemerythrin-like domain-containing protein